MPTWALSQPPSCMQCVRGPWWTSLINLGVLANNGMIVNFYSPHGCSWISCLPMSLWSMSNTWLECAKSKALLHPRLYKQFGVQWGMPLDYGCTIGHMVYHLQRTTILLLTNGKHDTMSRTSKGIRQTKIQAHHKNDTWLFTLVLHLKLVVTEHFRTESWEAMLAIQGSLSKAHTTKATFMTQMVMWPWGIATWSKFRRDVDLGHGKHVRCSKFSALWRKAKNRKPRGGIQNKDIHVKLNEWTYVNNLMDVWDRDNSPNMQEVLRHSQLPRFAKCWEPHVHLYKRLGRCKLRSCGPSTKVGTRGKTPNPLSTKIERCELESWHSHTFGYRLRIIHASIIYL